MVAMIISFWSQFGASPLWSGIGLAITVTYLAYIAAYILQYRAVRGSRNAYLGSTIMRTLCLPLFGAFVLSVAIDAATGNWIGMAIDVWISYGLHRGWNEMKDNDDWWTGKGTKLKKKLRSFFTASSPAAAGAGA